jgi:hypothetical protein
MKSQLHENETFHCVVCDKSFFKYFILPDDGVLKNRNMLQYNIESIVNVVVTVFISQLSLICHNGCPT